jgi:hypothetical protein
MQIVLPKPALEIHTKCLIAASLISLQYAQSFGERLSLINHRTFFGTTTL